MADLKIGISGCGGRMGRMVALELLETKGIRLAGGIDAPDSPYLGRDLGELAGVGPLGIKAGSDALGLFRVADAVIDFSAPVASVGHAKIAAATGKALVIGTTGLDVEEENALRRAARKAPILWAPNMSVGVNLLLELVREAAAQLGSDYDIEILEMHHRHKVDAPSGTALALGRAAAEGRDVELGKKRVAARVGVTGPRKAGDIGFAVLRGGDEVGWHKVFFSGAGEVVELAHRATSRRVFARGAVRAARWLAGKKPGLYAMTDVLAKA
ncbi:MAG: 4-hydroxy-tetrahydrodipicolinate reductase [Alphaproteobacteria bacterium]|nr:4-hydroxy-tetrahydrodipicolinate reductase [Alphaproteobacteria bacterium]